MRYKKVNIVYYSGTGGTQRVAIAFEKAFTETGCEVLLQQLCKNQKTKNSEHDLLVLLFAVHACNAPEPIYRWLESIETVKNTSAVVISVSAGGEVTPNTACRLSTIKRLEEKGYTVAYEKMLVMPSNWIISTKEPLAVMLLDILPVKVKSIVDHIDNGVNRRTKPKLMDRLFSHIGELEKAGAKKFGKKIKVTEACNGCGWCKKSCPAGNISMDSSKPEFGGDCNLCLKCIYGCPQKALVPSNMRFLIIKEGYDLCKLELKQPLKEKVDVESLAKGFLWSGVKKYLLDCD